MDTEPTKPLILVVDDSIQIGCMFKFLFEQKGEFCVDMATSGTSALEKSLTLHPDLILTDGIMPAPDGWECCKILKQTLKVQHIPILIYGILSHEEYRAQSLEAGAVDYLVMLMTGKELLERIRQTLALTQT